MKGRAARRAIYPKAAQGNGAAAPAVPAPLTIGAAFDSVAARRRLAPQELFTNVVEAGLVAQAEQGQGWAVKLLVDHLCENASTDVEPDQPLSPAGGLRIYEIIRAERGR